MLGGMDVGVIWIAALICCPWLLAAAAEVFDVDATVSRPNVVATAAAAIASIRRQPACRNWSGRAAKSTTSERCLWTTSLRSRSLDFARNRSFSRFGNSEIGPCLNRNFNLF